MAPMGKRTKIEKARQFLKTGGVLREDSDDELGTEDYPWEWIYESSKTEHAIRNESRKRSLAESDIVGARMGKFECYLGDCVLLKADGNEAWVGIVTHFFEDEDMGDKMANLMWFSTPREVMNKVKPRPGALEVNLFSDPASAKTDRV